MPRHHGLLEPQPRDHRSDRRRLGTQGIEDLESDGVGDRLKEGGSVTQADGARVASVNDNHISYVICFSTSGKGRPPEPDDSPLVHAGPSELSERSRSGSAGPAA